MESKSTVTLSFIFTNLRESWSQLRGKYGTILKIGLIMTVACVPFSYYFEASMGLKEDELGLVTKATEASQIVPAGIAFLIFAGVMLATIIGFILLAKMDNTKLSLGTLYKNSFKKLPVFVAAFVLFALCTAIGLIFLVIPGLIFAVWFIFSLLIVLSERISPIAALKKSRNLVSGKWWPIAINLIVIPIIFIVPNNGIAFLRSEKVFSAPLIIEQVLFNAVNAFLFFPFLMFYWWNLYQRISQTTVEVPLQNYSKAKV